MATKNTDKTEDKPAVVIELTADEIKANAKAAKVQIDMINNLETAQEGLAAAIAYLRSRDKYLLDNGKWIPTPAGQTDVRQTIAEYREAMK